MIFDVAALESLNNLLATAGIFAAALCALLLVDLWRGRALNAFVRTWGLPIAFGISTISIVLTLVYSELFGITPCGFCWLERMALYPQVLLIGVAFYYKDRFMPRYGIALSIFGFVLSLYHHYIQMGGTEFIACPTSGAECAKRFMFEYGFVTFPLLSAVLFAILIVLYVYILRSNKAPTV